VGEGKTVLSERLSVIAGDGHDRRIREAQLRERSEDAPQIVVGVENCSIVEVDDL
jgi:hypothetical protein